MPCGEPISIVVDDDECPEWCEQAVCTLCNVLNEHCSLATIHWAFSEYAYWTSETERQPESVFIAGPIVSGSQVCEAVRRHFHWAHCACSIDRTVRVMNFAFSNLRLPRCYPNLIVLESNLDPLQKILIF